MNWADLEHLRWPNGIQCPECGIAKPYKAFRGRRRRYRCRNPECRSCFTAITGTVFHGAKQDFQWYETIIRGVMAGMSFHQMALSVGSSIKWPWYFAQRIKGAVLTPVTVSRGCPVSDGRTESAVLDAEDDQHTSFNAERCIAANRHHADGNFLSLPELYSPGLSSHSIGTSGSFAVMPSLERPCDQSLAALPIAVLTTSPIG